MRKAFFDALYALMKSNDRVFLLTTDLGFSLLERFRESFPGRFINVGVAESNMVGIAAGLALSEKIVYAYDIASFVTTRCFEQVRLDICLHNLPTKLIGSGGGLTYGAQGPTHHAIEDISIMRSLANMTVVCPGDPVEAELAVEKTANWDNPVYIRLETDAPKVHETKPNFEIGKGIVIKDGYDLTLIATGNMLYSAKCVADDLFTRSGLETRLVSMHTVKPIDRELIMSAARETKIIFTLEEHSLVGGLGSAVAEVLAENAEGVPFRRFALPDRYLLEVGGQEFLRGICGLSVGQITEAIKGSRLDKLARKHGANA